MWLCNVRGRWWWGGQPARGVSGGRGSVSQGVGQPVIGGSASQGVNQSGRSTSGRIPSRRRRRDSIRLPRLGRARPKNSYSKKWPIQVIFSQFWGRPSWIWGQIRWPLTLWPVLSEASFWPASGDCAVQNKWFPLQIKLVSIRSILQTTSQSLLRYSSHLIWNSPKSKDFSWYYLFELNERHMYFAFSRTVSTLRNDTEITPGSIVCWSVNPANDQFTEKREPGWSEVWAADLW